MVGDIMVARPSIQGRRAEEGGEVGEGLTAAGLMIVIKTYPWPATPTTIIIIIITTTTTAVGVWDKEGVMGVADRILVRMVLHLCHQCTSIGTMIMGGEA